ncbi:MAG: hypothetical protein POELPBGB_03183 [Bacteroidia bacterium]|nr:hypothetical protein [Bacteroidia bacterium]
MYLAVRKLLNDNNIVWAAITGFASVVTLFFSKITLIQNTENRQQRTTKGVTGDKKVKKAALIEKMLVVSGGIQSFANDTGNQELYELVNFTSSDLEKVGDSLLIDRANLILTTGNTHAADILPKGITAIILGELQTLITEYDELAPSPRNLISNKKTATEQLVTLFGETDELLKKNLDKLMMQFKASNPEFYIDYFNNREIIDLGTQHTRLGGVITDSEGNPLEGVTITAEGADLVEVSDAGGAYLFKPFIPGDFTVTFEKAGFVTQTLNNVHVSAGQHLVLDVVMAREVLTVTINGMQVLNIFGPGEARWVAGVSVKIKNITQGPVIGGGHFYTANTAAEGWDGTGTPILPGQQVIHTVTAAEYKPYMNGFVPGPNTQVFEVTLL